MPWLSLAWGVASGLLISRDASHTWRFLVFSLALVVFSALLSLWFLWRQKMEREPSDPVTRLGRVMHARSGAIEWLGVTAAQIYAQYILMFSLPLLFFARAWNVLLFMVVLVASTLWDPWFVRLFKSIWYRACLRVSCVLLAASYVFSLFLSEYLEYLPQTLATAAALGAFPWHSPRIRSRADMALSAPHAPFFATLSCVCVPLILFHWTQFPLLSVWMPEARFAAGDDPKEASNSLPWTLEPTTIAQALTSESGLCCVTPVVAPPGFASPLMHRWSVDGKIIDTIPLPAVRGLEGERSFRTFSCKRNLPNPQHAREIVCAVLAPGEVSLGRIKMTLTSPDPDVTSVE